MGHNGQGKWKALGKTIKKKMTGNSVKKYSEKRREERMKENLKRKGRLKEKRR